MKILGLGYAVVCEATGREYQNSRSGLAAAINNLIELEAGEPERLAFILNRVSRRPLVLDQLREICEWIEASQPTP